MSESWKEGYRGDLALGSEGGMLDGSGFFTLDPTVRLW